MLKASNINMGIVTSRTREEVESLAYLDIEKYFIRIVTSDETIKHKPDKEPIEKIITDMSLDKSETIYIGDAITDAMACLDSGVTFALAKWGALDPTILADIILNTPNEILNLIPTKDNQMKI